MEPIKQPLTRKTLPPGAKNVSYALVYNDVAFETHTADLVITKMMDGMYLGQILKSLGLKMSTIRKWEKQSPDFAVALADARKTQAYMLVEETLEDIDGGAETVPEASVLKLKVENKRWIAEKYNRDQFAQKVDMKLEHSLADVMDSIRPSTDDTDSDTEPVDTEPEDAVIIQQLDQEYIPKEIPDKESHNGESAKS